MWNQGQIGQSIFIVVQLFFLLLLSISPAFPSVINETLVFSRGIISADNFPQEGILTNGQFPGPPIKVSKNDTVIITVVNKLSGEFALHLHGILQVGSADADGVPLVTQFPIPPNGTYVHQLHIGNQSGTFMYHAHTGLDLVWAFGPFIIGEDPEVKKRLGYAEEFVLQLSQCWHEPIEEIHEGLVGSPFADVPDTASLLINGRSWGEWNQTNQSQTNNTGDRTGVYGSGNVSVSVADVQTEGYEVIKVRQNETYRFRVIGLGMDSMLALFIDNHTELEVVEVDGVLTDSAFTDFLQLNSAQRYSILVKMNQPIGNYWIRSEMLPGPGPRNGRAILHYEGAPNPSSMTREVFHGEAEELHLDNWILDKLHPSTSVYQEVVYPIPQTADRTMIIKSYQRDENNHTKFDINGIIHHHTDRPLLHLVQEGQDILTNTSNGVYELLTGQNVQMVFENRMSDEGECEQHPWHMHGHTFYVVGQGPDSYDPSFDGRRIDEEIRNGTTKYGFRDVVTLFPEQRVENKSPGAPCGWVAIRFIADNPGVWLVHCHLTPHQIMGKWFVLYEHSANKTIH